jgi:hypothetical protein
MNKKVKLLIFAAASLLLCEGFHLTADDDKIRHRERKRERHRGDDHYEGSLKKVNNPTYIEACGACHFVYQPELLPSGSWVKILDNLDDHFGETVELVDDSKKIISDYLKSNGAENSSAKRAVKIVRSLGNQYPLRITDIPYIREKHSKISSDILMRKTIGSLSNCPACHTTAESGIYDDDNVIIPQ